MNVDDHRTGNSVLSVCALLIAAIETVLSAMRGTPLVVQCPSEAQHSVYEFEHDAMLLYQAGEVLDDHHVPISYCA